ncbi:MAG: NAD(P)-dependent oxidoreductase [Chloroflexota bacterium]|jgi:3-hydroxyisobutyrate dehydrogenase-like beta-hydroxyacid dehydrogenase
MAKEKIAFLGLGIMGSNIVRNLLKTGYPVTVYNRTASRAEPLVQVGAHQAASPREAVADAEIIMIMLNDDTGIEEVVFGKNGALEGVKSGQIVVDLTTCMPKTSLREATAFNSKGVEFLDSPVFGSKGESRDGGLWIVVGGKKEVFDRIMPIYKVISATQHYMGENGKGSSMKLVGNLVVAAQIEALGEAMTLAVKAGLDPKDVLGVLDVTDFKSPIFSGVGRALCKRDFSPSFYLKLMLKDANLIAAYAQELNVATPSAAATREVIKAAVNKGWGEENASAFIKVLEQMSGVEVKAEI